MGNTQAPHEAIYEQALRRIAALDETWQEAVRGTAVAVAPAAVVVPAAPAAPAAPVLGPAAVPALPPLPRAPMTATAEITAVAGPDTTEAVIARAGAPRWRRSLAY